MGINRFQTFSNAGQIAVDPWKLPYAELNLALASKQADFDKKEAKTNELKALLPQAGPITQDYKQRVDDTFNPMIDKLTSDLYATGEVSYNEIMSLGKKIANDPMIKQIDEDRNTYGPIGVAATAMAEFPYALQDYYNNETGTLNQLNPDKFDPTSSIASKYKTTAAGDFTSFARDEIDKMIVPFFDVEKGSGDIFKKDGVWHIKKSTKNSYIGKNGAIIVDSEVLTESIFEQYIREKLTAKTTEGVSFMDERYKSMNSIPSLLYWNERFQKEHKGTLPTIDDLTEMYMASAMPLIFSKQTPSSTTKVIGGGGGGGGGKGNGTPKVEEEEELWANPASTQYRVNTAQEIIAKSEEITKKEFKDIGINDMKFVQKTLDDDITELVKQYNSPSTMNKNEVATLNSEILTSIDQTAPNGKVTYALLKSSMSSGINLFTTTGIGEDILGNTIDKVKFELNPVAFEQLTKATHPLVDKTALDILQANLNSKANNINQTIAIKKEMAVKYKDYVQTLNDELGLSGIKQIKAVTDKASKDATEEVLLNVYNHLVDTDYSGFEPPFSDFLKFMTDENIDIAEVGSIQVVLDGNRKYVGMVNGYNSKSVKKTKEEIAAEVKQKYGANTNLPFATPLLLTSKLEKFNIQKTFERLSGEDITFKTYDNKAKKYNEAIEGGYTVEGALYVFSGGEITGNSSNGEVQKKQKAFVDIVSTILMNTDIKTMNMSITNQAPSPEDQKTLKYLQNSLNFDNVTNLWKYSPQKGISAAGLNMQQIRVREDKNDGWVLDILIPEINADDVNTKGPKELINTSVEIKLNRSQMMLLMEQTGLVFGDLEIDNYERNINEQLTKYGYAESSLSYSTETGPGTLYTMTHHNNPDKLSEIESNFKVDNVNLNLKFNSSYEIALFQNGLNSSVDRFQYRLSEEKNDANYEAIAQDELYNLVDYLMGSGDTPLMSEDQAIIVGKEVLGKSFVDANTSGYAQRTYYNYDDDNNYKVNHENMVDLASLGIPTQSSKYSLLKLQPIAAQNLKAIMEDLPGLVVTNALRSIEDTPAMKAAGFTAAESSTHMMGYGVDLAGLPREQALEILEIINQNKGRYGVSKAEWHNDNHIHMEFDSGYGDMQNRSLLGAGTIIKKKI